MSNKLPPELHIVHGTRGTNQGKVLPESIKKRTPYAEWLDNPDEWNKKRFIEETSDYLFEMYGLGSEYDRHLLAMLAITIDNYIKAYKASQKAPLIAQYNNGKTLGPNPFLSLQDKLLPRIQSLMNEMGLTARGRLALGKDEHAPLSDLLAGPKVHNQ